MAAVNCQVINMFNILSSQGSNALVHFFYGTGLICWNLQNSADYFSLGTHHVRNKSFQGKIYLFREINHSRARFICSGILRNPESSGIRNPLESGIRPESGGKDT